MATKKKVSTELAVPKKTSSAVVSIQEQLMAQAAAMAGRIAPSAGSVIKLTKDKKFHLPDGRKIDGPIDLVIIDFVSRNKYYDRPFDASKPMAPACYATNPNPLELAPNDNVPEKQNDECKGCWANEYKSAPNGKGKACKNTRYLAVMMADAPTDSELWFLEVSPTGLKNFDSYVPSVVRMFTMPPIAAITEVAFDEDTDFQLLTFSNPRPNQNLAEHFARQAEAKDLLSQDIDTSGWMPISAPTPRGGVSARKPAAARR